MTPRSATIKILRLSPLAMLAACAEPSTAPLTLPPATGTPVAVQVGAVSYLVTRSRAEDMPDGEALRVYRRGQPGFDYSEGLVAKTVAETFCGTYNRGLDPRAQGIYEALGADWLFPGGCA